MPTRFYQDQKLWLSWNDVYTTSSSTSTTIWTGWNTEWTSSSNTITVSTSTGNYDPWGAWQRDYYLRHQRRTGFYNDPPVIHLGGPIAPAPARPQAPAYIRSEAEWEQIRAENERLRRERDELQKAARAEARKLLAIVLTPAQMDCYLRNQYFDVVGSEGGVYRLYHGTSGNIERVIDGQGVNRLCVHPDLHVRGEAGQHVGYLPTEDSLAAQALAIMHDERGAVLRANVHRGERHLRAVA